MPIDGPLMVIDGPHGTAMAIDELRWDLITGFHQVQTPNRTKKIPAYIAFREK